MRLKNTANEGILTVKLVPVGKKNLVYAITRKISWLGDFSG
jgi:hypothetical protein